ncbi:MAG: hypothetical protein R2751_12175 [Bacteroidales bacterium]
MFLWLGLNMVRLPAQILRVESVLASDSLMIGDQVAFSLRLESDPALSVRLPLLTDTLTAVLELVAHPGTDTVMREGRRVITDRYMLTSFEPGTHLIPALDVVYEFDGQTDTARSLPLFVRVHEPEVDTSQAIRAIRPPVNTPVSLEEVFPWMLLLLGISLAAGLAYYLIRRFLPGNRRGEGKDGMETEPAHVIAFRELDQLKEARLWEKGEVKRFYTRLTEISRQYIERQYGIPAMEQTSEEILNSFRRENRDDTLLDDMLRELLGMADLVKFAKEEPSAVENQSNLNAVYIFVQKTYPMFYAEKERKEDADATD